MYINSTCFLCHSSPIVDGGRSTRPSTAKTTREEDDEDAPRSRGGGRSGSSRNEAPKSNTSSRGRDKDRRLVAPSSFVFVDDVIRFRVLQPIFG